MNIEKDIIDADPERLSDEELESYIGDCVRKVRQINADLESCRQLRKGLRERKVSIIEARRKLRIERRGRQ